MYVCVNRWGSYPKCISALYALNYGNKYCPTLEAYFDEKHIIKNISQEECLRIDSVKKALTRTLIQHVQAKNRFKKHCENRMCVQG